MPKTLKSKRLKGLVKNEANLKNLVRIWKHIKRENRVKFKLFNDIIYSSFKIWEASVIYVNGPLLKEEAMNIKQSLSLPELEGFKDRLDKWKISHSIKEKQISGGSLGVSESTVAS